MSVYLFSELCVCPATTSSMFITPHLHAIHEKALRKGHKSHTQVLLNIMEETFLSSKLDGLNLGMEETYGIQGSAKLSD